MGYTSGDWIYNSKSNSIESTSEWLVKPEDDEDGVPIQIISTFAAMGGDDINADIKLICAAPKMIELLLDLLDKYDITTGGISSSLSIDEINKIKNVVNSAI